MRRKTLSLLVGLALLVTVGAVGSDVAVHLRVANPRVIFNEPLFVVITVTNNTQSSLRLPFDPGAATSGSDMPELLVRAPGAGLLQVPGGRPAACERRSYTTTSADFALKYGPDADIQVPPCKSVTFAYNAVLPVEDRAKEGNYELLALYRSEGKKSIGGVVGEPVRYVCDGCWKGEAEGAPVLIRVEAPSGVDAEAYKALKGDPLAHPQDLLAKFPASTYAGYFLGLGAGFPMIMDSKPEYVVKTLWRENYLQNHPLASVTREVTKDGKNCQVMGSEPMRGYLQAQRSKIESYLALHPDHARREIVELARAYQSLALGDKDTALRSLEWVSCNAPAQKWREQGLAVLDLLKAEK